MKIKNCEKKRMIVKRRGKRKKLVGTDTALSDQTDFCQCQGLGRRDIDDVVGVVCLSVVFGVVGAFFVVRARDVALQPS